MRIRNYISNAINSCIYREAKIPDFRKKISDVSRTQGVIHVCFLDPF